MVGNRTELKALKNLIADADLILSTTIPLPENRTPENCSRPCWHSPPFTDDLAYALGSHGIVTEGVPILFSSSRKSQPPLPRSFIMKPPRPVEAYAPSTIAFYKHPCVIYFIAAGT